MGNIRRPVETAIVIAVFVTSIFFGVIYFLNPFIGFNLDTLKTSLFYLFSTNAQVLAALIGISFAFFYTSMSQLRTTENNIYNEPLRKLFCNDPLMIYSVIIAIISITISLLCIIMINYTHLFSPIIILISFFVLNLSITSMILICFFAFYRYPLYLEPQKLVSQCFEDGYLLYVFRHNLLYLVELNLLIDALGINYNNVKTSLSFIESSNIREVDKNVLYFELVVLISQDINKIIPSQVLKNELYSKIAFSAWLSVIPTNHPFTYPIDIIKNDNVSFRIFNFLKNILESDKNNLILIRSINSFFKNYDLQFQAESFNIYYYYLDFLDKKMTDSPYYYCDMDVIDSMYEVLFDQASFFFKDWASKMDTNFKDKIFLLILKVAINSSINILKIFEYMMIDKIEIENFYNNAFFIFLNSQSSIIRNNVLNEEIIWYYAFRNHNVHPRMALLLIKHYKLSALMYMNYFTANYPSISYLFGLYYPYELEFYIYTITSKYNSKSYSKLEYFIYDEFDEYFKQYNLEFSLALNAYDWKRKNFSRFKTINQALLDEIRIYDS